MSKTFLFQAIQIIQTVLNQLIQFNISIDFLYTQLNVKPVPYQAIQFSASSFNVKTVPFQTIQFSISMQFVLFNPLIGPSQVLPFWARESGPGTNGNEGVFCNPQSSSITGTSPSDCLVSYPGHWLGIVSPLGREAVGVFYTPSRLGKAKTIYNTCVFICTNIINSK